MEELHRRPMCPRTLSRKADSSTIMARLVSSPSSHSRYNITIDPVVFGLRMPSWLIFGCLMCMSTGSSSNSRSVCASSANAPTTPATAVLPAPRPTSVTPACRSCAATSHHSAGRQQPNLQVLWVLWPSHHTERGPRRHSVSQSACLRVDHSHAVESTQYLCIVITSVTNCLNVLHSPLFSFFYRWFWCACLFLTAPLFCWIPLVCESCHERVVLCANCRNRL